MLRKRILYVALIVAALALLLSLGCAKKKITPTGELSSAPAPTRAPAEEVTQPEVTAQEAQARVEEELAAELVAAASKLRDVFFAFDDYSLSEEARGVLASDGKVIAQTPKLRIAIEGHCDERGTIEYNLALGEKRAMSAKNYLVNYGIDPSRISTVSYGKERPFDSGHDEGAWAKNRRAHVIVQK
ncbi:MAG: peptidoglycan-associated lipoprotein Pal [Candidatus Eisenbacteria bacterium]|nr:peptidoglycan-associated lipoprotein Pal [Candidatus Eisenbacteria bacterium]